MYIHYKSNILFQNTKNLFSRTKKPIDEKNKNNSGEFTNFLGTKVLDSGVFLCHFKDNL